MAHIHDVCEKITTASWNQNVPPLSFTGIWLAVSIQCDLEHFSATLLQIPQCSMTLNKKNGSQIHKSHTHLAHTVCGEKKFDSHFQNQTTFQFPFLVLHFLFTNYLIIIALARGHSPAQTIKMVSSLCHFRNSSGHSPLL